MLEQPSLPGKRGLHPRSDPAAAAAPFGVETVDPGEVADTAGGTAGALIEMTSGRRPDAVIDAVGTEAHG
jgi:hypothetical protein